MNSGTDSLMILVKHPAGVDAWPWAFFWNCVRRRSSSFFTFVVIRRSSSFVRSSLFDVAPFIVPCLKFTGRHPYVRIKLRSVLTATAL
jgi:hypothetical protein